MSTNIEQNHISEKQTEFDKYTEAILAKETELKEKTQQHIALAIEEGNDTPEKLRILGFDEEEIKEGLSKKDNAGEIEDTIKLNEQSTENSVEKPKPEPDVVENKATEQNPEKEKNSKELRKELAKAREAYSKELKKCLDDMRRDIAINRLSTKTYNILAGAKDLLSKEKNERRVQKNPEDYKEEDYTKQSKEYAKLEEEYKKAKIELGIKLMEEKTAELVVAGFTGEKLAEALERYGVTGVLNEVVADERQKVINEKIALENKNIFLKAWDAYKNMPRWKKALLSTTILLPVSASTGFGLAIATKYGIGALMSLKFGASMATGHLTTTAYGKMFDQKNNKENEKFQKKYTSLDDKFVKGDINQKDYALQKNSLDKENRKRLRDQNITKIVRSVALGMGTSMGMYGLLGHEFGVGSAIKTNVPDHTTSPLPQGRPWWEEHGLGKPAVEQHPLHNVVEAQVHKGHGAIQTIHELQKDLKAEYPDPTKAPPSVQHILNTKADKLAMEYGMYKPGQTAESALTKTGWEFNVDKDGNVVYQHIGGGHAMLLEKGLNAKHDGVYTGKMFDSDHHVKVGTGEHTTGENHVSKFETDHPQKIPYGVKTGSIDQKIPDGVRTVPSQTVPAGVRTGAIDQKIPDGVSTPKIEDIKTNLTALRNQDISPTRGIYDNSNGTNTGSISPTRGIYNTGEANTVSPVGLGSNNSPIEGNGFTREVPMTNQATAENLYKAEQLANVNTGNATENTIHYMTSDPRHLETAADIRHTFGASNVKIERPSTSTVNGIKYEEWNRGVDQKFQELHNQKGLDFNSYDQYEKEKELQTLLGVGEKKIVLDPTLNENIPKIEMNYFRETPEWTSIERQIPAKYFFDFKDVKLVNGDPLPKEDIDKLVDIGMVKDNVTRIGGVVSHEYVFKNHDQLERLQKMYERLVPKAEQALGNDRPIGDETLEKYIERITHRVYETDNGTLYGFKENVNLDNTVTRAMNNSVQPVSSGNIYQPVNNSTYINPTYGGWQTSSDYDRRIVGRTLDIIGGYNRWTH